MSLRSLLKKTVTAALLGLAMQASAQTCEPTDAQSLLASAVEQIVPALKPEQKEQLYEQLAELGICASAHTIDNNNATSTPPPEGLATLSVTPQTEQKVDVELTAKKDSVWPASMVSSEPFMIRSTIAGQFSGWRGKTIFILANGQRWIQRKRAYYRANLLKPEVEITKNAMGFYRMTVVASGKSVAVKPVRP
ncbi:MAG: hypothetical protein L7T19_03155 [Pseudomonadales bacterium]|jgi:hypothetical protein|nr:hypothetical protein [Pseudomonadales bacterium]